MSKDKDLKNTLSDEQYHVTQEKGTEPAFSGRYHDFYEKGMYSCIVCGSQLFSSDTKFESTEPGLAGWPSFDQALPGAVEYRDDDSLGMHRTEIVCANCDAHLGHVFDAADSKHTGKHFCVNSCAIDFNDNQNN